MGYSHAATYLVAQQHCNANVPFGHLPDAQVTVGVQVLNAQEGAWDRSPLYSISKASGAAARRVLIHTVVLSLHSAEALPMHQAMRRARMPVIQAPQDLCALSASLAALPLLGSASMCPLMPISLVSCCALSSKLSQCSMIRAQLHSNALILFPAYMSWTAS